MIWRIRVRVPARGLALALSCGLGLWAQSGDGPRVMETGGMAGFAMMKSLTVQQGSTTGKTGFDNGFVGGAFLGRDSYKYLGGEVRYLFRGGAAMVDTGSRRSTLAAQQHLLTYDLLWHFAQRGHRVRPFVSGGGGMRWVRGTGTEHTLYPGSELVALTATNEVLPAFGGGGGVKIRVSKQMLLRIEFRDYISPAPKQVLAETPSSRVSGWMHDFMPLFGISYQF